MLDKRSFQIDSKSKSRDVVENLMEEQEDGWFELEVLFHATAAKPAIMSSSDFISIANPNSGLISPPVALHIHIIS